ncbi:hypothetical protein N7495_005733 [Penicillium taxi]|uniref:uncharacterized protein n=1 Tax=Penicillium taxi TaxID=168475 RepID=UPI002545B6BA|nr:uncharacterized protein N7495_005733 [Penicillium taxi]KAJ5894042.1 hypothetical protein N7495_005733 [Penicillium taxi]
MSPEQYILLDGTRNVQMEIEAISNEPLQGDLINKYESSPDPAMLQVMNAGSDIPVMVPIEPGKLDVLCACMSVWKDQEIVKFIISNEEGHIIRSDIFEDRLRGRPGIRVVGLVHPRQFVYPPPYTTRAGLGKLLEFAVCCILIDSGSKSSKNQLSDQLQSHLTERLSFPWLSPTPISSRRLAVVGEVRPAHLSLRFFQAAQALGVKVVAFGPRGHWLQDQESHNAQIKEAFIEVDLSVNPGLPDRILTAIQSYPAKIDGVTTVTEFLLIPVAQAAERLGLPTSPTTSFIKSVNKHKTRLEDSPSSCLLVSSLDTLQSQLASGNEEILPPGPPWIVKPCNGWHSLGVSKVATKEGLAAAVERVAKYAAYSRDEPEEKEPQWQTNVLIEEYCDGPEVDCNFVLWDGQILFFEVIDNLPCAGDEVGEDRQSSGNFKETQLVFPSALPPSELETLKLSLYTSITRLGFRSGVFHVEARVRDSSCRYRSVEKDDSLDLRPSLEPTAQDPTVFLIEINARPPGYMDTCASYFANGVDLFALQILIALEDESRLRALSQPYKSCKSCPHVVISAIQAAKSGVIVSEDPWKDLSQKDPTLMSQVVQNVTNFGKGDFIQDPRSDTTPWLSAFMAYSLKDRTKALEITLQVKEKFECEID